MERRSRLTLPSVIQDVQLAWEHVVLEGCPTCCSFFTLFQKLYAGSSRRSDVPEVLKKKHSKLQARAAANSGGGGRADDDDEEVDDDDDDMETEDEVLTDTNEEEGLRPKTSNNNKRKSDDSSDGRVSPMKKIKTEVSRYRFIYSD